MFFARRGHHDVVSNLSAVVVLITVIRTYVLYELARARKRDIDLCGTAAYVCVKKKKFDRKNKVITFSRPNRSRVVL